MQDGRWGPWTGMKPGPYLWCFAARIVFGKGTPMVPILEERPR
ncbi:MAG TPA: hypothetical protein VL485_31510 [Ktedonobacteraceae bacterium]|nr:hypothetical protein [Ktedonobacteraceae bacterium]